MRTYEFYFSGPRGKDPEFPFAPTVQEMYADFQQVLRDSGYTLGRCMISTNTFNDECVIEVNGSLHELATKVLPQYEADEGALTKAQLSQIKKSAPRVPTLLASTSRTAKTSRSSRPVPTTQTIQS